MLKRKQIVLIALAVFAFFVACQTENVPPENEDPEVPELPKEPMIPAWEKIAGLPEINFVNIAFINGNIMALDNQNLYRINPEDWTFTKSSYENPNSPNATRTPITKDFFAAINRSEIVLFSSANPQVKGKIDVNDFLEGNYSITAAYPFAPAELAINQANRFLFSFVGNDPENRNTHYLVTLKAQMVGSSHVHISDVKITQMEDVYSYGNFNLIYPVGDNFIFSMGTRTYLVDADGGWEEIIRGPIHSIIPFNDLLIGFGQASKVWLTDINGEEWSDMNWGVNPYHVNPRGLQIEQHLIQTVADGIAVVNAGFSGVPFEYQLYNNDEMGLPNNTHVNNLIKTETHVIKATTNGIYFCLIEDFLKE